MVFLTLPRAWGEDGSDGCRRRGDSGRGLSRSMCRLRISRENPGAEEHAQKDSPDAREEATGAWEKVPGRSAMGFLLQWRFKSCG